MGTYISQSDIEQVFGSEQVAKWADLDNDGTADSGVVTAAINYAEGYIEDRMRNGPYSVPLSVSDKSSYPFKHVVAEIAGWRLFSARQYDETPDWITDHRQHAEDMINGWFSGQIRLNADYSYDGPTCAQVVP